MISDLNERLTELVIEVSNLIAASNIYLMKMNNIDPEKLELATNILSNYTEDTKLQVFNIIHIYPNYETRLKDNDCYYDCLKFKAVIYNTELGKCRESGDYHDKLDLTDFYNNKVLPVSHLNVFADGSTLIKFSKFVKLPYSFCTQVLQLTTKDL